MYVNENREIFVKYFQTNKSYSKKVPETLSWKLCYLYTFGLKDFHLNKYIKTYATYERL